MIQHGKPPYLECSSRGDKRFSAFFARLKCGKTIEELYQAAKIFHDGVSSNVITGLTIKEAKGKTPINIDQCRILYSDLWDIYIAENPEYLKFLKKQTGLSDIFGQEGHACQATELWRISHGLTFFGPKIARPISDMEPPRKIS